MDNDTNSNRFDEEPSNAASLTSDTNDLNLIDDENNGRAFVWLLLGIIAIGCGLLFAGAFIYFQPDAKSLVERYFPSPTSTQTPTITPSPTPHLTATAAAEEWELILKDNFTNNKKGWDVEYSDKSSAKLVITVTDGTYNWDITSHKLAITTKMANAKTLGSFIMSVDARQVSGPETAEYGLVFRENSDFYHYYFGINNKRQYFLFLYNGEWITLINSTKSNFIFPYEYNRVTVLADGSHFTFFINDHPVAEFTDEHINKGKVGLYATVMESDQHAVFEFDNFELRAPK